jgi:methionyl aminopeptidase
VPDHIVPPDYVNTGTVKKSKRSCVKRPDEMEAMRRACAGARQVLDIVLAAVAVGVTTDELDAIAHEATLALGAYPSTLMYQGYQKSLCTSVNEVICHGIPDDRRLVDGDIVNCDVTIYLDGMHGDCSETAFVGSPDADSRQLVQTTYEAMMAGIATVRHGAPLNAIGKAIEEVAHKRSFSVVRDFTGHGIGEHFHMPPSILHFFDPRATRPMEEGMTFTIEPMINMGTPRCRVWDDGWTAVTLDNQRTAQFEHTILVTATGAEILTGTGEPWFKRQL